MTISMAAAASKLEGRNLSLQLMKAWSIRTAVILILGLGLLWLSLAITIADVTATGNAQIALAWWPWHAQAQAIRAAALANVDADNRTLMEAESLARRSLRSEILRPEALRALAVSTALRGSNSHDLALLGAAERVSRRDMETQLLLIENSVTHGDVAGALVHYDRALTINPDSGTVLFPILATAGAVPTVRPGLAKLLSRRPPWGMAYFAYLLDTGASATAIATAADALRPDPMHEGERVRLRDALFNLVNAHQYDVARFLFKRATPNATGAVRNGEFSRGNPLPPFDWQISDDAELGADSENVPGIGSALVITAASGRGGEVAKQLLMLPAGPIRLTARAGNIAGAGIDRPSLTLACALRPQAIGALVPSESGASGAVNSAVMIVPQACPAQWLTIKTAPPLDGVDQKPWITGVAVLPAAPVRP